MCRGLKKYGVWIGRVARAKSGIGSHLPLEVPWRIVRRQPRQRPRMASSGLSSRQAPGLSSTFRYRHAFVVRRHILRVSEIGAIRTYTQHVHITQGNVWSTKSQDDPSRREVWRSNAFCRWRASTCQAGRKLFTSLVVCCPGKKLPGPRKSREENSRTNTNSRQGRTHTNRDAMQYVQKRKEDLLIGELSLKIHLSRICCMHYGWLSFRYKRVSTETAA